MRPSEPSSLVSVGSTTLRTAREAQGRVNVLRNALEHEREKLDRIGRLAEDALESGVGLEGYLERIRLLVRGMDSFVATVPESLKCPPTSPR